MLNRQQSSANSADQLDLTHPSLAALTNAQRAFLTDYHLQLAAAATGRERARVIGTAIEYHHATSPLTQAYRLTAIMAYKKHPQAIEAAAA